MGAQVLIGLRLVKAQLLPRLVAKPDVAHHDIRPFIHRPPVKPGQRMGFHEIIAIDESDVFSSRGGQPRVAGGGSPAIRPPQQVETGVVPDVCLGDRRLAVSRPVVHQDDLDRQVALRFQRFQASRQIPLGVIDRHDDREFYVVILIHLVFPFMIS